MRDRLKEYRDSLDRSIFKEKKFTSEQKRHILMKIKNREQPKKRISWAPPAISLAFVAFLVLFSGYLLNEQPKISTDNLAQTSNEQEPHQNGNTDLTIKDETETVVLESPYQEIKDYFNRYELPEEGRVKGKKYATNIEYENGYTFDPDTKMMLSREYREDDGPAEPTKEQEVGVIMGWLHDASVLGEVESLIMSTDPNHLYPPLSRLKQVEEMTEFDPLLVWTAETIEIFETAQNTEDTEEKQELIKDGYNRLQKMNSIIEQKNE